MRGWRPGWPAALLLGLLAALHQFWLDRTQPAPVPGADPLAYVAALLAFAGSGRFWYPLLALFAAGLLPFMALVLVFERAQAGAPPTAVGALRAALRLWPAALLNAVAYLLAVCAGLVLLVPGIWLGGRWLLWPVALARDAGARPWQLERGAALLRGRWWPVNARVTLVAVVAALLALLLQGLLGSLPGALATLVATTATAPLLPAALVIAAAPQGSALQTA